MKAEEQKSRTNVARFFTHNRQIAWVALFATLAWGIFGYLNMPKRKDPDIPVRVGLAICPWPGIASDKVEVFETEAGVRFTGVGEPGKKITRLSIVPRAPSSMSFFTSGGL